MPFGGLLTLGITSAVGAYSAHHAASQQQDASQNALDFEQKKWADAQANAKPFVTAGQASAGRLSDWLSAKGGTNTTGALSTPYAADWNTPFVAPTAATEQNDPGYQFRLNQGLQGTQRAALAGGTGFGGGSLKALQRYAQDYASGEYGQVYGRAKGEYDTAMNTFQTNQGNTFQRNLGVAQLGAGASAGLNGLGVNYANSGANLITGAGNAGAFGTMGMANAIAGGAQTGANTLNQMAAMRGSAYGGSPSTPGMAWQGPPTPAGYYGG